MPDAAFDEPVLVLAGKFLRTGTGIRVWAPFALPSRVMVGTATTRNSASRPSYAELAVKSTMPGYHGISELEADFAEMGSRLLMPEGIGDPGKREAAIDHGP
jgi:hypothetical protein